MRLVSRPTLEQYKEDLRTIALTLANDFHTKNESLNQLPTEAVGRQLMHASVVIPQRSYLH